MAGFEPATPCSQNRCANRTALHPEREGEDRQLLSFRQAQGEKTRADARVLTLCGEGGIRTRGTRLEYASLANWWFQPLTHLTVGSLLKQDAKISDLHGKHNAFRSY